MINKSNLMVSFLSLAISGVLLCTPAALAKGPGKDSNELRITDLEVENAMQQVEIDSLVLDNIADRDQDPTNELQTFLEVLNKSADAGGLVIGNLGDPANSQDAATKAYVDSVAGADGDANPMNEFNISATLNGTDLEITDAGSTLTVDLSSLVDT